MVWSFFILDSFPGIKNLLSISKICVLSWILKIRGARFAFTGKAWQMLLPVLGAILSDRKGAVSGLLLSLLWPLLVKDCAARCDLPP